MGSLTSQRDVDRPNLIRPLTGPARPLGDSKMRCLSLPTLLVVLALPFSARADDKDAKKLAQQTLDKGASLFDARDAAALAATYTEDAQVHWIDKDNSTG